MDTIDFGRFILSFLLVVGLIWLVAWVVRKLGLEQRLQKNSAKARMKVVDSLMIDPRRRLVLIQRDGREHLLLLNATGDVVVESYDAAKTDQA